jgi:hypothetical protein
VTLSAKAAISASVVAASRCGAWLNDAPVARIDSPSAIMTKSWLRSARWPPSIVHSVVDERPRLGTGKPSIGAT